MINKKGFTLIELLVCITILGIITGMSIPVIRNLTTKNSTTKYSSYLDTVVNAAKLYVDSYGEDLFGYHETGCGYVNFEDLYEKKLVKDFNSDDITCNTTSTFVKVTKFKDSYSYEGFLGCANIGNEQELIYTLPNPETPNEQDLASCSGVDINSSLSLTVSPNTSDSISLNSINVTFNIAGKSGIYPDLNLRYKWSTSNADFSTDGMVSAIVSVPQTPIQQVDINAGKTISVASSPISTPIGESGKIYLIAYSDNLRDLNDNYWSYNDSIYVAFGPFIVDNRAPIFDVSSGIVSSNPSYNNSIPKLSLGVSDDVSPANSLQMCVSYSDYCTDWEDYNPRKELPAISGFQYDGTNYSIYVSVKDAAGNIAQREFIYKSYVQCTVQVDDGNWVGACPVCGTNVTITQTKNKKDAYLGTGCTPETREHACTIPNCCTSKKLDCTDYGDYGDCSKACAGGVMSRSRTCRYISELDGSDCGEVVESSELIQTVECNNFPCAPMLCTDSKYAYAQHTCDTFETFASSRNCIVDIGDSVSKICISYTAGASVNGVIPKDFCRMDAGEWMNNCENKLSLTGNYIFEILQKTGTNYSIQGGLATYQVYGK